MPSEKQIISYANYSIRFTHREWRRPRRSWHGLRGCVPGLPVVSCLPLLPEGLTVLAEALTTPAQQNTPGTDFTGNFVQGTWRKHNKWHESLLWLIDASRDPAMHLYPSSAILPQSARCHNKHSLASPLMLAFR